MSITSQWQHVCNGGLGALTGGISVDNRARVPNRVPFRRRKTKLSTIALRAADIDGHRINGVGRRRRADRRSHLRRRRRATSPWFSCTATACAPNPGPSARSPAAADGEGRTAGGRSAWRDREWSSMTIAGKANRPGRSLDLHHRPARQRSDAVLRAVAPTGADRPGRTLMGAMVTLAYARLFQRRSVPGSSGSA